MLRRMRRWAPTLLLSVAACATPATPSPTTSASPAPCHPRRARLGAAGGDAPCEPAPADVRRRERRGLLVVGGQRADLAGARARGGVRSHLPAAAGGRRAPGVGDGARVERARRDHLLVLPARRSRGDLRVDRGGRRRLPAPARSQPGLRLGALPRLRHLPRERRRRGRAAADDHAGLRRRGDGVRQGRLDRLHLHARRRHRPLPDGRRRQEREAPDPRRSATTAARSSTPTARTSSGARRGPSRARSWTTTSACSAQNLVRPSKLELYVDGRRRLERAPGDVPGRRVVRARVHARRAARSSSRRTTAIRAGASSTCGRSTSPARAWNASPHAPGFDGFPLFSPDGKRLAFSSNRATAPGAARHQRVRRRLEARRAVAARRRARAERARGPDPVRHPLAGRSARAKGAASAPPGSRRRAPYIEERFKLLGLEPAGDDGGYRQAFPVRTGLKVEPATALRWRATRRARATRSSRSGSRRTGKAAGRWCSPGYGLVDKELGLDDYAGLDARGKIVVVRRFVPEHAALSTPERQRRAGRPPPEGLARARARGARAAGRRPAGPSEGRARRLEAARGAAAVAAAAERLRRRRHPGADGQACGAGAASIEKLEKKQRVAAELEVALSYTTKQAFNVVGRLPDPAGAGGAARRAWSSSARTTITSASASTTRWRPTATCRTWAPTTTPRARRRCSRLRASCAARPEPLARDVVFVAVLGRGGGDARVDALHARAAAGLKVADVRAMINLDMVGRLRGNRATILGAASAAEWPGLLAAACARRAHRLRAVARRRLRPQRPDAVLRGRASRSCTSSPARTPTTTSRRTPPIGSTRRARRRSAPPSWRSRRASPRAARRSRSSAWPARPREGDARSFNASLGTIPDYAGPPGGRARRAAGGRARAAPRPRRAACGAATSWSGWARTRSAASRT